jgi:hypothetical protein
MTVREIDPKLQFISDSQDVEAIRESCGLTLADNQFDSFFVDTQDGDYTEVWGMFGIIPRDEKPVYRVL